MKRYRIYHEIHCPEGATVWLTPSEVIEYKHNGYTVREFN